MICDLLLFSFKFFHESMIFTDLFISTFLVRLIPFSNTSNLSHPSHIPMNLKGFFRLFKSLAIISSDSSLTISFKSIFFYLPIYNPLESDMVLLVKSMQDKFESH